MASGIFALLDDIALLMDDVAVMTKVAAKKTAGILGDDLAVNAEKASGFVSSRELPVLWAITKGSFLNKLIILPAVFALSALYPPAIIAILILGGLYLAYEGAEKIFGFFKPHPREIQKEIKANPTKEEVLAKEKSKIKSAIVTDFILSVEIIIITLGTVIESRLIIQILVVTAIAIVATIGVYGVVALLVRMDDLGHYIIRKSGEGKSFKKQFGGFLVKALPYVIKGLSIIGTIALFLVAGGIFSHNIDFFHHFLESIPGFIRDFIVGVGIGIICLLIIHPILKIFKKYKKQNN